MKRKIRRFIAIVAAFCIAFTGMPLMTGSLDAHAASKFTIKTAEAVSPSAVKLTWKKYKKSNAYEVYRDGELVGTLTKTTFTDEGLQASTEYVYKVKALKKYTQKQKQYFNKKTGEWQKKKPAKKYRGKSKTVKIVKYKTLGTSKPKVVETKAAEILYDDTDKDQDAGGTYVKVYALTGLRHRTIWSECQGRKNQPDDVYTASLQYNNNGFLKKYASNADSEKFGQNVAGTESYAYNGSHVREMLKTGTWGEYTVYDYENGKLKSSKTTYINSEEDEKLTTVYKINSLGRVEVKENTFEMFEGRMSNHYEDRYEYTKEGYYLKMSDDSTVDYVYDSHGNPVEYHYITSTAPGGGVVTPRVNIYKNIYTDGRLTKISCKDYAGVGTEIELDYKEISIPEKYYKDFIVQQHDIIFRYAHKNETAWELPLGLVG